jgi:hypothetical protein
MLLLQAGNTANLFKKRWACKFDSWLEHGMTALVLNYGSVSAGFNNPHNDGMVLSVFAIFACL